MNIEKFFTLCKALNKERLGLMERKGADYADDADFLDNFKRVGLAFEILKLHLLPAWFRYSFFLLLLKLDRWANLVRKGSKPKNEGVVDTVKDMHNYIDLTYGLQLDYDELSEIEKKLFYEPSDFDGIKAISIHGLASDDPKVKDWCFNKIAASCGMNCNEMELKHPSMPAGHTGVTTEVQKLVSKGIGTDGGHHKQWYLCEIAKLLGVDFDPDDSGIAP